MFIHEELKMKWFYIVAVIISLSGCSIKNTNSLVGFDGSDIGTDIRTTVQLQENEIYMVVRNIHKLDYEVWVVFNFTSKSKNSIIEEQIHGGDEYQRNFIVTIPDDKDDSSRESVTVYVTSAEEYDINKIVRSIDMVSSIKGGTTLGGFITISGFSVLKKVKYFQTPEIVLNRFKEEGSYGNSLSEIKQKMEN